MTTTQTTAHMDILTDLATIYQAQLAVSRSDEIAGGIDVRMLTQLVRNMAAKWKLDALPLEDDQTAPAIMSFGRLVLEAAYD